MSREMKYSGIGWIGDIPKEWDVRVLKRLCNNITDGSHFSPTTQNEGKSYITVSNVWNDKVHLEDAAKISIEDFNNLVANGCQPSIGAVLLAKDGTVGRTAIVEENDYVVLSSLGILSPSDCTLSKYLKYLLDSDPLQAQMQLVMAGSALRRITITKINKLIGLLPPLPEQQKIADYLDKVCGEADEMIALQEKMIEELKAYKQSVINEAVTKGLNPNVPMKDSGIDWIGEIPEHWGKSAIKHIITNIESGVSVNAELIKAENDELGVLKTSSVSSNYFIPSENKRVDLEEYNRVSCPVKADTIIVSRMNTPELVGAAGYCNQDIPTIFLPDRLWQVHFDKSKLYVKFGWYYLISSPIKAYYSSLSSGTSSSMQNISQPQFCQAFFLLPPIFEQKQIASYLDTKCSDIDSLIAVKQQKIEELKEYKKSIIYEYVTGKKNIL